MIKKYQYDAFISYRRTDPDEKFATEIHRRLAASGFKIAIDRIDFKPNSNLPDEIERCISDSKYTLIILSPRYLESGNTMKEATIATVKSMQDRKKRTVPIYIEKTETPYWLYDLVGIRFDTVNPLKNPYDQLLELFYDNDESQVERVLPLMSKPKARNMLMYGGLASGGIILVDYLSRQSDMPNQKSTDAQQVDGENVSDNADNTLSKDTGSNNSIVDDIGDILDLL